MLLLVLALASMPTPIGRPLPVDLGMLAALLGDTRTSGTRVEITVDASGQPIRCDVTRSQGMPRLDRIACAEVMRTARFQPARDAAGRPVSAVMRQDFTLNQIDGLRRRNDAAATAHMVDFALPVAGLASPDDVPVADMLLMTDADGRVTQCDIAASTARAPLDRLACRQMLAARFAPARDRAGQPVAALRRVSVGFTSGPVLQ